MGDQRIRKVDTSGIITTVAGLGGTGFYGDGGQATNASFAGPAGVAVDAAGNLYIADSGDGRVRVAGTNGIIRTFAGNGSPFPTPTGDGGQATNATLGHPLGLAIDRAGNLYIADMGSERIRKVSTNGVISTIAGIGTLGYSGDGGAATNARLFLPSGVALDTAGNLFIADAANSRVRKVDPAGIITTLTGNVFGFSGDGGPAVFASLNFPYAVAPDSAGNLYIADYQNSRIRKVDPAGIITTIAGNGNPTYAGDGGAAAAASLNGPIGLALDANGNLYISDSSNHCIREIHFAGFPTLALNNVSATNAGSYTVVVSSPYGSVTSAVATLTVNIPTTPPLLVTNDVSFGFVSNYFGFNVGGASGQTIVVDGSTNLVDWTPLLTNIVGNVPPYFRDPGSTNLPGRFYRARLQ